MNIPDAPEIRRAEATGYDRDIRFPRCPICGAECEEIHLDRNGDVCGCDVCMTTRDAWEWQEEQR